LMNGTKCERQSRENDELLHGRILSV
jgi:hypothetical protein